MDKKYQDISKVLTDLGLFMNDQTGGMVYPESTGHIEIDRYGSETKIKFRDDTEIVMLDGDLFLKSLRETENSFNIQFFVNV